MQNGIHYPQRMVFRALGGTPSPGLLGGGVMHKKRPVDFVRLDSPRYVAVLVVTGQGIYRDEETGREYELGPGTVFQRIPGRLQSNWLNPELEWSECYLETGSEFSRSLAAMRVLNWAEPVFASPVAAEDFVEAVWAFLEELSGVPEERLPGMTGKLVELLWQLHKPELHENGEMRPVDVAVEMARQRLERDFAQEFDMRKFCRKQGCGYEHFRKRFKERVGISPWQYRVKRRLDAAVEMLGERVYSMSDIADRLGYSSEFEFSAQFKRAFGRSPSRFLRTEDK